jgi:hypothetical protein
VPLAPQERLVLPEQRERQGPREGDLYLLVPVLPEPGLRVPRERPQVSRDRS